MEEARIVSAIANRISRSREHRAYGIDTYTPSENSAIESSMWALADSLGLFDQLSARMADFPTLDEMMRQEASYGR